MDGLHNQNEDSDQINVIVGTSQNLLPTSSAAMRLRQPPKTMYSGGDQMETDLSDNETVFVTTEDDGAGGTVTFVQNIKGENISKEDGIVQTEYVLEDNLQTTSIEIDNGKIFLILWL